MTRVVNKLVVAMDVNLVQIPSTRIGESRTVLPNDEIKIKSKDVNYAYNPERVIYVEINAAGMKMNNEITADEIGKYVMIELWPTEIKYYEANFTICGVPFGRIAKPSRTVPLNNAGVIAENA